MLRNPTSRYALVAVALLNLGAVARGEQLRATGPEKDPVPSTTASVIATATTTSEVSGSAWHYTLLRSAEFVDDCLVCGRPTIILPLQGSFLLRLIEQNPLFATYAVEEIAFVAGTPPGPYYKITGSGTYRIGGEVALVQTMILELWIDDGTTPRLCTFTNNPSAPPRPWPIIETDLEQADGSLVQVFKIAFVAAPIREIWFSTTHGFTPGVQPPPVKHARGGDLVSDAGRVVRRYTEFSGRLGLMPSPDPPDLGLDCVDILPGGEVAFSTETDAFSELLGFLHHGDLLSDRGRIIKSYSALIAPFSPMPPLPDPGLDALQVLSSGEVYFSVETDFFSQKLGRVVRRGDLLSDKGYIVKTQEELLAKFNPPPIPKDFGLDAVYVWPGGEIWFSLEEDFQDGVLGVIRHGDLLSDRGEIIYKNHELLRNFQPLEDLADFGLDAVFIVSDAVGVPIGTAQCVELRIALAGLQLRWQSSSKVRQLEKAFSILGPWQPVGPLTLDMAFIDPDAPHGAPQAFYRLREW